ncbi:cation/acetate symporter [Streptomyces sp. Amel2xB2]|uniref:sodium:solute symporter family transporter n=1 Tax=Streptomyces sp. Amel2xB2 TaxID=1305829 RepID=UPI000DB92246|nr:cation acetate symporter [Streptomyces sp. Amel2xB2]RAJ61833.1 cation/acetate symporter [Streptomyces sp. Amel2xB2]
MSSLTDAGALTMSVFLVFLAGCLFLSMLTSPDLRDAAEDFFAQRGSSTGTGGTGTTGGAGALRQGLALTGDFVSAAGLLFLCGIVATGGHDGILIVAATALSPLLLKVLLAERLPAAREFGPGRSLGDILARRLPPGPARRTAGVATLVVSVPLLVAQLVPVGGITAAVMGLPGEHGAMAGIALTGILILACAAIGGARGSTLFQTLKAVGFLLLVPLLALLVLARFGWDHGAVVSRAAHGSGIGEAAYLASGRLFGADLTGRLDTFSLALTVLLGAAFLPHLLTRLSTSRTAETARRSSSLAVIAVLLLCVTAGVVGHGVQALAGAQRSGGAGPHGGDDLLLLAAGLDGSDPARPGSSGTLLTFIACAAFLAALASASVLLLSGSAAVVLDIGRHRHAHPGKRNPGAPGARPRPLRARIALGAVGAVCIALAVFGREAGAQFWLTLSWTEAATVVLPALGCALLCRRFTLRGLRWCVYGGTLVALTLLALSPAVSGSPESVFPDAHWAVFPLHAPGLVSVPVSFLLAWTGTRLTPSPSASPSASASRTPSASPSSASREPGSQQPSVSGDLLTGTTRGRG